MFRTIAALLFFAMSAAVSAAAAIKLDGLLQWEMRPPDCEFTVTGAIQNVSPGGVSGTLKLVLWASAGKFPSPGFAVAEQELGQLTAGYQMADFSVRAPATLAGMGRYYLSVYIAEYTTAGWQTRAFTAGEQFSIRSGYLLDGEAWAYPVRKVSAPAAAPVKGTTFRFRTLALSGNALIHSSMRTQTKLKFTGRHRAVQTGIYGRRKLTAEYGKSCGTYRGMPVRTALLEIGNPAAGDEETGITKYTLYYFSRKRGVFSAETKQDVGVAVTWGTFVRGDS